MAYLYSSALQGHVVGSLCACCPWTGMLGELHVQVDAAGECTDHLQTAGLQADCFVSLVYQL